MNTFDGLTVVNYIGKTSFYVELASITFKNSSFKGINSQPSQLTYGSAIQCVNCITLQFNQSSVSDSYARYGGAIYIEESDNSATDSTLAYRYIIDGSTFKNNESPYGGVLYALSTISALVVNSNFDGNKATGYATAVKTQGRGSAGAIYFTCSTSRIDTCAMTIGNNNTFVNNYAEYRGGAIYWDLIEPMVSFDNISFSNNSAVYYGSNIACFAQRLVKVSKDTFINQ